MLFRADGIHPLACVNDFRTCPIEVEGVCVYSFILESVWMLHE